MGGLFSSSSYRLLTNDDIRRIYSHDQMQQM